MKNKKPIKIKLKTAIILSIIIIAIITAVIIVIKIQMEKERNTPSMEVTEGLQVGYEKTDKEDKYIIKNDYQGEYDLQVAKISADLLVEQSRGHDTNQLEIKKVMSYAEYEEYCEKWKLNQKYKNTSQNYIVYCYSKNAKIDVRLAEVEYTPEENVRLYIWDEFGENIEDISACVIVIPTDKTIKGITIKEAYTQEEYDKIKNIPEKQPLPTIDKPIIYLYPKKETEVSVKLGLPEQITCSYPKYTSSGWKVLAKPSGELLDLETRRNLYSLYYESNAINEFKIENTGFVVKGEETSEFLEEKLKILGLTDKEAEEFIIYWLPKLESNNYNYIRFATKEEVNLNMLLNIEPNPDTVIRVLMIFKGLDTPISVKEQKLITPERKGFVAVEWGGTEIK